MPTIRRAQAPALRRTALAVAMALAGIGGPAQAADNDAVLKELKRLNDRIESLERNNRELERKLEQAQGHAQGGTEMEKRLKALEESSASAEKALQTDRISEQEPELVTRLKAVEFQTLGIQKQARQIEALEGISVGASLTGVVQNVNRAGAASGKHESRANYRGDIAVTLPGGGLGSAEGKIFAQFRFGQGEGVGLRPTYTSTPNTTAFQVSSVSDPDSSFGILAQAWYQLDVPLPWNGYKPHTREHLELNFGKIDPFIFFDQNAAADDETARFMNNAFVHNPLLDSGGDINLDKYGFAPGVRLAYMNEQFKPESWAVSLGAFGSGSGANFSGSISDPFVIAQIETSRRFFGGLAGNYRLYGWTNGRAANFDEAQARHSGWGVSVDQRVGDAVTLFGRYGHRTSGHATFDNALTLGAEIGGTYWGRAADALGIAGGVLRTSAEFRKASALDADGDGTPDLAGYAASGSERVAEVYYRYRVNSNFDLTPDFQIIQRPGGDGSASTVKVSGVRARIGF